MIQSLCKDPFRLFFPVALFCLFYASGLWTAYGLFELGDFPVQEHANLFLGGFLSFSILGFLLTAIPRFTSTDFLSFKGLICLSSIILATLIFYFLDNQVLFWLSISCGWICLFIFGIKRFLRKKQNPPFTFIFVGLGLIFGFTGSLMNLLVSFSYETFESLEVWGKLFFYDGMVTAFILGVGGRLIPGILGFSEIVQSQRKVYEESRPFFSIIPKDIICSLLFFVTSFILEGIGFTHEGFFLRAIVITYFSFRYWRIHEKIKTGKWHGRMLKVSCVFLFITSWLLCFFIEDSLHIKHLIYIGTYCLMTLMVASRVIIAHGNESLDIEHKKNPYLLVGSLVVLAALTRASAHLIPNSYIAHLGYAGLVLLSATLIWSFVFLKRCVSPSSNF
ncbi:MAG: NnrS family protein [Bacteriovoracaceae bacterium]